jgi:hypothetical protein
VSGKGWGVMAPSASDAVATAVERLRAAREQAKRRREASRRAVEQLRQRNREESRRLAERARLGRRAHPQWPEHERQPRELHLYDAEELDHAAPQPAPPPPPATPPITPSQPQASPQRQQGQQRPSDDDWSQESWLH